MRVSTRTLSPMFTNSGTLTWAPVSSVAGFVPPPEAVSPRRPGSVSVTSRSTALGICRSAGWPSIDSSSTSSFGRVHLSGSASVAYGIAICSNDSESMKWASVPSA